MRYLERWTVAVLICAIATGCAQNGDGRRSDAGPDTGTPADSGADATVDAGPEVDCANGVDDDLDGMPDCGDPDCEPIMLCVPTAATGWSAPSVLEIGNATAPPCEAPYPSEAYVGHAIPAAPQAVCSACSCSDPVSTGCLFPPNICQKNGGCSGSCNAGSLWGSGCIEAPSASSQLVWEPGAADTGTCEAGTSTPTLEAPVWQREARLCAPATAAAAGCGTGEVCMPRPTDTQARFCVVQSGDRACPAGYEDSRELFYAEFDDQRGCSACTCTYRSSGCGAAIDAYEGSGCTGNVVAAAIPYGVCVTADPASYAITPTSIDPGCDSFGGQPIGTVQGALPSTVCCRP